MKAIVNETAEFKMVYERYARDVFAVIFHCTGNREDSEDILQEVFIRLSEKMKEGLFSENPKYWLIRVALNLCIDAKRRVKRYFRIIASGFDGNWGKRISEEEHLVLSDSLRALFRKLNSREKMVLVLKYMEEMDYQEISKVMELPVGTLKSTVFRALNKIKGEKQ